MFIIKQYKAMAKEKTVWCLQFACLQEKVSTLKTGQILASYSYDKEYNIFYTRIKWDTLLLEQLSCSSFVRLLDLE